MNLDQRLYSFLFEPASHMARENWTSVFSEAEQAQISQLNIPECELSNLLRQKVNAQHAIGEMDLQALREQLVAKLALLDWSEWKTLGLGIAVLPFAGRIGRSMDGNFRRGVRTLLSEADIEALDQLPLDTKPQFLESSLAWKDIDAVAMGGVKSLVQELCHWDSALSVRAQKRFPPSYQEISPIVTGLKLEHLESLCKILFPTHQWLQS
jgi:hypothetical protein